MPLELESLRKAVDALQRSLVVAEKGMDSTSEDLQDTIRSGVIQNFEVAYEQSWKFVQRWLSDNRSISDAELPRTRRELFRMAARYGIISDPAPWFGFGDARNLTSHTYDLAQATSVFETARQFLPFAIELLERLEESND
jgi:nucleotidyltransferase substrate binding protein (TIGR01987 family)